MSFTMLMMNRLDALRYGLALPANVAEQASRFGVGKDQQGREYGCWWFAPPQQDGSEYTVIYSGTFDADNAIGDHATTQAELFNKQDADDRAEYEQRFRELGNANRQGLTLEDDGLEGATEKDFEVSEQDTGEEIIPFDLGTKRPLDAGDVETPE